jgi:hypothetical protein
MGQVCKFSHLSLLLSSWYFFWLEADGEQHRAKGVIPGMAGTAG